MQWTTLSFIGWIVVGGLSGWLVSVAMGTNARQGCFSDIILGIAGAFVGGFVFNLVASAGVTGVNLWSIFVAFIGSLVVLGGARLIRRSA